jgi:uncharacterized membrane protein
MGHTSGLAKGFAILALVVFGAIAVVSGIAYGLAAFFQNPYLFAVFTAAAATGLAYLFYQTRGTCLIAGFSGLVGGAVGSVVTGFLGGIFGVLAGMVVCVVVVAVVIFGILAFRPRSNRPGQPSESWRKSRAKTS